MNLLQGKAKRVVIVQPGKEKFQGDIIANFQYLKGTNKIERDNLHGRGVTKGEWICTDRGQG